MGWQLNTNSPLFRAMSPQQQQQLQNQPVPPAVQQQGLEVQGQGLSNQSTATRLPGEQAQSNVAVQTAPAQVTTANADAVRAKNEQDKINAIAATGALFQKNKGKDGKVSPQDYNAQLGNYVALGGSSDDFNNKFQDKYVNPNNVWYDTPDNISVRKSLPQIANTVKSYAALDKAGPNWEEITKLPVIGDLIKKNAMGAEIAHDDFVNATIGGILKTAGAGQGSTIRGSLGELNKVIGLLPLSSLSKDTANQKIGKLDQFLQSTYGTSLDDWMQ